MAFPTTGILDSFPTNGANLDAAKWSGPVFSGQFRCRVASQQAGPDSDSGTSYCNDYYSAATFGPDCEAYVTFTTVAGTTGRELFVRLAGLDGSPNGYGFYGNDTFEGANTWEIYRIDNGAAFRLGATFTSTPADGDAYGFEAIGSTLTVYRKPSAGSWASVTSRTDATYGAAGNIGMTIQESLNAPRNDDFGGGTVVTAALDTAVTGQSPLLMKLGVFRLRVPIKVPALQIAPAGAAVIGQLGTILNTDTNWKPGTLGAEASTSTYSATTLGATANTANYPP
jgi:hypothetical protein